jgi:hypothetical protein
MRSYEMSCTHSRSTGWEWSDDHGSLRGAQAATAVTAIVRVVNTSKCKNAFKYRCPRLRRGTDAFSEAACLRLLAPIPIAQN